MMKSTRLLATLLLLGGCMNESMGTDFPDLHLNANEHNLRAMIADPADLHGGRQAASSRGAAAADPVQSLIDGKVKPLTDPRSGAGRAASGGNNNAPRR